jgi:methionyl-tRNA synthetase
MQEKYFGGIVQPLGAVWDTEDQALREVFFQAESELRRHMENLHFHRALVAIWGAIDHTNRYIVQTSPFVLVKDPEKRGRVGEILHHLLEALRLTSHLLAPFLPETVKEIREMLAIPGDAPIQQIPWGEFFKPGHQVKSPKVLFPRIE